ncbi:MAG: hypothetical protein N2505_00005, partial [Endomicrobia bacterium]|nr:hypothetical protein [Endomicrobiia bacterium]
EYPYELVTNENFIKRIENLHRNMWENQNCSIIIYIKEGIYYDLNIFLYGDTHKEIEKEIDILKKRYTPSNTNIERIETLIGRYLRLKQDIKRKKELLTYLTTAKTRKRKIILYSIVIDLMNSINKKSKSLFYLAFEKNVGCSLIETKMINEFKQFLSL